jgi:formylglycine-generating enzyme required for sulfatase activity
MYVPGRHTLGTLHVSAFCTSEYVPLGHVEHTMSDIGVESCEMKVPNGHFDATVHVRELYTFEYVPCTQPVQTLSFAPFEICDKKVPTSQFVVLKQYNALKSIEKEGGGNKFA